jgi:UDP-N-acetylmuramate--alanine ligase
MNIYFSGLGGVGIGPLAEIAHDAGHYVTGSDLAENLVTNELEARHIPFTIGQDGAYLQKIHDATPIDWFVHTSALPADHTELQLAKKLGIRTAKRDEFLAEFLKVHNLKLIAISGTHGKTTTTGMMVWALKQLNIPVSYSVGTTISFGPSGAYDPASEFFVYECDEYDRNLLHFSPFLSLLTSIDYDHPDTYPTEADYKETFRRYITQSDHTIAWQKDLTYIEAPGNNTIWALADGEVSDLHLAGEHNRRNATLILKGLEYLQLGTPSQNSTILENFPGTDRRFEKLADNLYSDYGHHPEEIAATLQLAREVSDRVVLVYQPHQNWRQHLVRDQYTDQFDEAETIYWLPTYLTRENPDQATLSPQELTTHITNQKALRYAELNDTLWNEILKQRDGGALVLCMGAGTIDSWVRERLATTPTQP